MEEVVLSQGMLINEVGPCNLEDGAMLRREGKSASRVDNLKESAAKQSSPEKGASVPAVWHGQDRTSCREGGALLRGDTVGSTPEVHQTADLPSLWFGDAREALHR